MLSNIIGKSKYEITFSHKLLLTDRQVSKLCKTFGNNLSDKIKWSKNQLSKILQSWRFLGRLLGPLLKSRLALTKNALTLLAKDVLIPLGLAAVASATDTTIQKKFDCSGTTTLIVSNEKM